MTKRILRVFSFTFILWSLLVIDLKGSDIKGGLKFNSYEEIKDNRTGINFTPDRALPMGGHFKMSFYFSYWREFQAYGHIFRIIGSDDNNIDLISSPYNSKFDDLNLILGDSATAVSFSFEEIGLQPNKWILCELTISPREHYIALSLDGKEKRKTLDFELEKALVAFGKNMLGKYTTSDVPPLNLREVTFEVNGDTVRHWPLVKYRGSKCFDELGAHVAEATNPNWMVDRHVRWQLKNTLSFTGRPQVVFDQEETFYVISPEYITSYNMATDVSKTDTLAQSVALPFNQASMYMKDLHEIWCYDLDSMSINKLSLERKEFYEVNSNFVIPTSHWHANKVKTQDGKVVFFGGYGHYTYNNELLVFDSAGQKTIVSDIEPRYLSALGQNSQGKTYVFGGYGSKNGSQEYGARSFHNLYELDLEQQSAKELWTLEEEAGGNVFSNSLVFGESDSLFYVLRYPRDKFNSKAVLEAYDLFTGEKEVFEDSIDLDFLDTNSYVDLLLNKKTNELTAVILSGGQQGYDISFYTLDFPPLHSSEIIQSKPFPYSILWSILGGSALLVVVMFWIRKRRRKTSVDAPANPVEEHAAPAPLPVVEPPKDFDDKKSAILFLGGFQVLDKQGNEISEKFSSTLRTLLTMLLLYSSNKGKGVPSNFIWEALWSDKSQNSARNNRNVNIKKLRDLLESVGDITIKSTSDKWQITFDEEVFFDYGYLIECLEEQRPITPALLGLIKRGNILPSLELDWVDGYKAKLSNKIVDYLITNSRVNPHDADIQLDIADSIFQHDIINQDALSIKVRYLNAKKKFALAKKCYESYEKEYELLYGEAFDVPFDEFVKGSEI
ncbi:Kelch repeat-containing protein [Marinoscillum furvescens]|uniref:DNA-binding SARP family transcriptional activator n=1 Tax=Marinoscillum furvescens DSM 4134 TaxID=1122208 RepID=A0A3D9L0P8_MARFU|nr:hypothetical protein [Marinoscillum furvescens]RED94966.1 hypothetical protein C7460_11978 [Marinoscillum furvescens DSM 4134]